MKVQKTSSAPFCIKRGQNKNLDSENKCKQLEHNFEGMQLRQFHAIPQEKKRNWRITELYCTVQLQ